MKKYIMLILTLVLGLSLFACSNSENQGENPNDKEDPPKTEVVEKTNKFISKTGTPMLCSHRGGSVRNPENTLKAFIYSVTECNADILESDVWITKDGHLVLLHDATVTRTSDATQYLNRNVKLTPKDFTLAELKELNFGYNFTDFDGSKPYKDIVSLDMSKEERVEIITRNQVSIITLEELFDYFYEDYKDLLFIIEIKNSNLDGFNAVDKINEILTKYPDYINNLALGSFNDEVQTYINETYKYMHTGASTSEASSFVMDVLLNDSVKESYGFTCLQIPTSYNFNSTMVDLIDEKLLQTAHEKDIAVQYWTINDRATMEKLIDAKCDAIMTDDPTLLRTVLNEKIS